MDKQNSNNEWQAPSGPSNITDSVHNSRVAHFVEHTHSLRTFQLLAGICQILLGTAVITVSILGLIQPLWLSTAMVMLASVTTIIGLYLVYITVSKLYDRKSLLRNAMRRVMESKN